VLQLLLSLAQSELELLFTHFLEVFDRVFWRAQLNQDRCCISYLLVPVLLKIEYFLPNCERDEGRVAAKDVQVIFDFYLVPAECLFLPLFVAIIMVILSLLTVENGIASTAALDI